MPNAVRNNIVLTLARALDCPVVHDKNYWVISLSKWRIHEFEKGGFSYRNARVGYSAQKFKGALAHCIIALRVISRVITSATAFSKRSSTHGMLLVGIYMFCTDAGYVTGQPVM